MKPNRPRPQGKSNLGVRFAGDEERPISEREWRAVIRNSEPARRAEICGDSDYDGDGEHLPQKGKRR